MLQARLATGVSCNPRSYTTLHVSKTTFGMESTERTGVASYQEKQHQYPSLTLWLICCKRTLVNGTPWFICKVYIEKREHLLTGVNYFTLPFEKNMQTLKAIGTFHNKT